MKVYPLAFSVLVLSFTGCGDSIAPPTIAEVKTESAIPPAANPPASPQAVPESPPAASPVQPTGPMEEAKVGVGKKGRGYGGGMISEPVRAYFRVGQFTVFDVQIPKSMQIYKAMQADGKGPKTHEEFMEKIIKENSITLPELPDGDRYIYDPKTEQLMVEHPPQE